MSEAPVKRRRRTNAEILADQIAARNAPKQPRKRRTKAEMERDRKAAEAAQKAANPPKKRYRITFFVYGFTAFGNVWSPGETAVITEGTPQYGLAFDSNGNFIFGKTPSEQKKLWNEVRYQVVEEEYYEPNSTNP